MKTAKQQCPYATVDNLAIGDVILMFVQQTHHVALLIEITQKGVAHAKRPD